MTRKSIVATILVIVGVVVQSVVMLGESSIDPRNPVHVFGAIAFILPGILFAAFVGLAVALVVHLFSTKRSRDTFFLIFSIFFLLPVLIIAFGTFEDRKLQDEARKTSDPLELSSPYTSNSQGFRVAFPTKPKIAQGDYSPYGIEGKATIYVSTKQLADDEVVYYVIVNDMKALAFVDAKGRKNYYEQFPVLGLSDAGAEVSRISSTIRNVYNHTEGVEYKYRLEADGETLFKRGIDFIRDGKGYQVSIIYPRSLDNQIENIYSEFVSSFSLL